MKRTSFRLTEKEIAPMSPIQRTVSKMNDGHVNQNADAFPSKEELIRAIQKTVSFFRQNQGPDGQWAAELEGDALLQSETILLTAFLGEEDSELARGCAKRLVETVLPGGGWEMFPGAGPDVTNSVKGYFALKLTGHDPASEIMAGTRETILRLGGAERVNSFTRFYLALLGQIPYDQTPAVPPQMVLIPNWFPINIYSMSSWSRTIFVPLSIVSALQPVRRLPPEKGIRELMIRSPKKWPPLQCPGRKVSKNPFSWDFFFRFIDKTIWQCRRLGWTPLRQKGIEKAKEWTLSHFRESDGPGAIYPPIIWAWIAFKTLGSADDSPEIVRCRDEIERLTIREETDDSIRIAPCKSPVWDTALVIKALRLSGVMNDDPAIRRGEEWLLRQQTRVPGDWNQNVSVPPGGWAFEYNNPFYPDNDDTAMALMVLSGRFSEGEINARYFRVDHDDETETPPLSNAAERTGNLHPDRNAIPPDPTSSSPAADPVSSAEAESKERQVAAGEKWLLAMQNKDGGWGAFDKGNTRKILCRVPFADHNAMIDPSCPDLTGRVLESFGRRGYRLSGNHPFLDRCLAFMKTEQEADGSWFGRWGVNYLYGTWQALTGLAAVGVDPQEEAVRAGANWLLAQQQSCGGWGESPDSYRDPALKGKGTPTASQTAWAVMGLIAAGYENHPAALRGIRYLIETQRTDGRWNETAFTGTGFPQVFYLKYHYYAVYFPLMALAVYASKTLIGLDEPTPLSSGIGKTRAVRKKDETESGDPSRDALTKPAAANAVRIPQNVPPRSVSPAASPLSQTAPTAAIVSASAAKRPIRLRLFRGGGDTASENGKPLRPLRFFKPSAIDAFQNGAKNRVRPETGPSHEIAPRSETSDPFEEGLILPFTPTPCPPLTLYIPEEESAESDFPEEMIFRFESYL